MTMTMTITVAYRRRGSPMFTHYFHVDATRAGWTSFYAHARLWRRTLEYARVVRGEMVSVL